MRVLRCCFGLVVLGFWILEGDLVCMVVPFGISYVVTDFAMALESLLVYYTITDKSTSARI
jgi:hypothetical protein